MTPTTNAFIQGFTLGANAPEESKDAARKFMAENGYKLTSGGKMLACGDLRDLMEDEEYGFWSVIIMSL